MSQHLPQAAVLSTTSSAENGASKQTKPDVTSFQCQWAGCNYLPRMKWSFAAHLLVGCCDVVMIDYAYKSYNTKMIMIVVVFEIYLID